MGSTIAPPQHASPASSLSPRQRQYQEALDRANYVRCARAAFKRRLASKPTRRESCQLLAELIAEPPDVLEGMLVMPLLMCCRQVGLTWARKFQAATGVSELRPLRALTAHERQRLIGALRMVG